MPGWLRSEQVAGLDRNHRLVSSEYAANPFDNEDVLFFVLVNDEGQHSLWPDYLDVPAGWTRTGPHADKAACMAWVDEHWTDMRPLSLVRQMEEDAKARAE